jgi:phosphoenolpyruvate carboxylase
MNSLRNDTSDLRFNVSRMLADFREDHSKMAQETKTERGTFVSDLRANVAKMHAGFREARARMSEEIKNNLSAFTSGVKRTVADFRHEFMADLVGVHRVWRGLSPAGYDIQVPARKVNPRQRKSMRPW